MTDTMISFTKDAKCVISMLLFLTCRLTSSKCVGGTGLCALLFSAPAYHSANPITLRPPSLPPRCCLLLALLESENLKLPPSAHSPPSAGLSRARLKCAQNCCTAASCAKNAAHYLRPSNSSLNTLSPSCAQRHAPIKSTGL